MYFLNRFLICFCSLLVCSGHRNCSKGHMQKGKIQNIVNSFNFSLKVILIFTAIDSTVMHLEQLIGETKHLKKKKHNIKVFMMITGSSEVLMQEICLAQTRKQTAAFRHSHAFTIHKHAHKSSIPPPSFPCTFLCSL